MYTLKTSDWVEIKSAAQQEMEKINPRFNRKRIKAAAYYERLGVAKRMKMADITLQPGQEVRVIYTYTNNLGTKQWADTYTEISLAGGVIKRFTPKYIWFGDYYKVHKGSILAVLED